MGPRHARNYGYYGSYNRSDLGTREERMDYIPERVDWTLSRNNIICVSIANVNKLLDASFELFEREF